VDYYDKGGNPNKNLNGNMRRLNLTDQEKKDLVAFLKALSGEGWQHAVPPEDF
jgi:cytochrome c peroxidase